VFRSNATLVMYSGRKSVSGKTNIILTQHQKSDLKSRMGIAESIIPETYEECAQFIKVQL